MWQIIINVTSFLLKKYILSSVLSRQKIFLLLCCLPSKNIPVGQLPPVKKNIHFAQHSHQKSISFAYSLHCSECSTVKILRKKNNLINQASSKSSLKCYYIITWMTCPLQKTGREKVNKVHNPPLLPNKVPVAQLKQNSYLGGPSKTLGVHFGVVLY